MNKKSMNKLEKRYPGRGRTPYPLPLALTASVIGESGGSIELRIRLGSAARDILHAEYSRQNGITIGEWKKSGGGVLVTLSRLVELLVGWYVRNFPAGFPAMNLTAPAGSYSYRSSIRVSAETLSSLANIEYQSKTNALEKVIFYWAVCCRFAATAGNLESAMVL